MTEAPDPLAGTRLFGHLSQKQRRRLADGMRERKVSAGHELTSEGQGGIAFFVLVAGEAVVRLGEQELGRLGPGDHFGEVALIDGGPRTATVTAETELHCLGMDAWTFRSFVRNDPDVLWALLVELAGRLRRMEERRAAAPQGATPPSTAA